MNHWQTHFYVFFILERVLSHALCHVSIALTDGSILCTLLHNAALVISRATERETHHGPDEQDWCEVEPHSCWWPPSCSVMYLIPKAINKVMLIRYRDSTHRHTRCNRSQGQMRHRAGMHLMLGKQILYFLWRSSKQFTSTVNHFLNTW